MTQPPTHDLEEVAVSIDTTAADHTLVMQPVQPLEDAPGWEAPAADLSGMSARNISAWFGDH